jgi:hypothetical protein
MPVQRRAAGKSRANFSRCVVGVTVDSHLLRGMVSTMLKHADCPAVATLQAMFTNEGSGPPVHQPVIYLIKHCP